MQKLAIIAVGGNSLITDSARVQVADQYEALKQTAVGIAQVIQSGYRVVVTHGNGPQVGYILRRSEVANRYHDIHPVPLVACVADTQGAIGFYLQQALENQLRRMGLTTPVSTIITRVLVDQADPAFIRPDKPIGSFYSKAEVEDLLVQNPGWTMKQEPQKGWRRVVPSPLPRGIEDLGAIKLLLEQDVCVVAVGGGGIPVAAGADGGLEGIDAVIDKDRASSLLARELGADLLLISTNVDRVCKNYGRPDQEELSALTAGQARELMEQGHFAPGSMLPKVEAAVDFVTADSGRACITSPRMLYAACQGEAGTWFNPDPMPGPASAGGREPLIQSNQ